MGRNALDKKGKKVLAQRVKTFRLERGWTQKRMAAYLGVSEFTFIRIETGRGCGDITLHRVNLLLQHVEAA